MEMQQAINKVLARQDLTSEEMTAVMQAIMTGGATPAQIGGFLVGLRMKGETVTEIAAAASVMRELASGVAELETLPNGDHLLTWSDQVDHQGTPYSLHYFHVGHTPAPDTLQLALFTVTMPEARTGTEYAEELIAATLQMIVNIEFSHWDRE